jgi:hypothetical protein
MTEQNMTAERESGAEERPKATYFWKDGDKGCWREATERLSLRVPEPEVCPEHLRVFQAARKMDALLDTLEQMGEWIAAATSGSVETPL